mmetsp:Transcript_82584/g.221850  ORF Transcript_82584/g.221850 Transcript_82584/m.221850 type:complete len:93 (+) Transcript_82584:655-933(+)
MPLNGFPDGLLKCAAHRVRATQGRSLTPKPAMQLVRRDHPQSPERQPSIREIGLRLKQQEVQPPRFAVSPVRQPQVARPELGNRAANRGVLH